MRYPDKNQIAEILNSISEDDFVEILPPDASSVDKVKYQLCKKFEHTFRIKIFHKLSWPENLM